MQSGVFSHADGHPLTVTGISPDEAEATVPVLADHPMLTLAWCNEGSETNTLKV